MKPIGLKFKNIKPDPYTGKISGEPMIVHLCLNCGKISSNRIAGDDNAYTVVSLLEEANKLPQEINQKLANLGIKLLSLKNKSEVLTALYGYDYLKYWKI